MTPTQNVMKLWTIQHWKVVDALSPLYRASWDFTPQNFRSAYRWMIHHLAKHSQMDAVPVWCWHSCNGKLSVGPTVDTASSLIGDWKYFAHQMRVIELDVPHELPLLSSYYEWNQLLDEALETQQTPDFNSPHISMFDSPLIKHDADDIQAVLPLIEKHWVLDIRALPETNDSGDDWI